MATQVKKEKIVHHWRCSKCGRTADSSVRPGQLMAVVVQILLMECILG